LIDVQRQLRDIRRANELGDDFSRVLAARQNLDNRIQDLSDRIAPRVLEILETLLVLVETAVPLLERTGQAAAGANRAALGVLESASPVVGFLRGLLENAVRSRVEAQQRDENAEIRLAQQFDATIRADLMGSAQTLGDTLRANQGRANIGRQTTAGQSASFPGL